MATEEAVYVETAGHKYKLQTLKDFRYFRQFALSEEAWIKHYSDELITVESRPSKGASGGLNVVRVHREMQGIKADDLYDSLHDANYRKVWDDNMIEGYNILSLNAHNDIGYYAVKFPWPLSNRDFCNMRSWMEFSNGEYIIFNHSVTHKNCPVKKNFVRANSILTGYFIQPLGEDGCRLVYITHCDPGGSIPHTIINVTTTRLVPKVMNKLEQCAKNYPAFLSQNRSVSRDMLPWRTPKMDWDSRYNFPHEEILAKENLGPLADNGDCTGVDGDYLVKENAKHERRNETVNGTNVMQTHEFSALQQATQAESVLLTSAEAGLSEETIAIQQYRSIMRGVSDTVDQTFLQDGRVPSMADYLTRVAFFVDGIRQTMPE